MFNSAKARLTIWYAAVLGLTLTLFALVAYSAFAYALESRTNRTLSEIASIFETTAGREVENEDEDKKPNARKNEKALIDAAAELGLRDFQVFAFTADGRFVAATKMADSDARLPIDEVQRQLQAFTGGPGGVFRDLAFQGAAVRLHYHQFSLYGLRNQLLVVHSLGDQIELLRQVRNIFLIAVPLSLLIAGLGGYFLASRSLAPIGEMSRKAEEITANNLSERLPVANEGDELGRLAAKFNELLARLQAAFEQQTRFMADASHELRTPVAIVRGEADVILGREKREEKEYRESFEIIRSEAVRMTRIIEDLFTLARADSGQQPLQKEAVYLDEIVADTARSFRTLADPRSIALIIDAAGEMAFHGDRYLLTRLFSNLIDNAVKHARSRVAVSAEKAGGRYRITVSDDGEGIPAEAQQHIFDRFFRADKARGRDISTSDSDGAGLGLSIAKFIAGSHGGTLTLVSSDAAGTVFRVEFPAEK